MNVCELIDQQIKSTPDATSIVAPKNQSSGYDSYTFSELGSRINRIGNKLLSMGVNPGDKVLLFLKPDKDFCAITFALFKIGAVGVFIDPGMPKKMFFKCIKDLKPDVLIGIPKVHVLTWFFPRVFRSIKLFLKNTSSLGLRAKPLFENINHESDQLDMFTPQDSFLAAILFTSGGTGPAKGVEYTHDIFINQTMMLKREFNLSVNDIDIPGFPLFSFFTLAMGMKSVVPDMDFAKPRNCNPALLYKNITDHQATFLAGSPAIWERLARYCLEHNLTLPTVKYVAMFGAPVNNKLHEMFKEILPNGTTYTPYGATECLPVTNISGEFILSELREATRNGEGICVGSPLGGVEVEIKNPDDSGIGDIVVYSKNVTQRYYNNPIETKKSKIIKDGKLWHIMGDVGYLKAGMLWFCGRRKHSVKVDDKAYYPAQIEGILNDLEGVGRSALINDDGEASVVIEGDFNEELFTQIKELLNLKSKLKGIKSIYFYPEFPVDIRHNIKIDRTALSKLVKRHG